LSVVQDTISDVVLIISLVQVRS